MLAACSGTALAQKLGTGFPQMSGTCTKGVGRKGFPWFVLICSENKSEKIGRNRSKSEQIGAFPKTRTANLGSTPKGSYGNTAF